MSNCKMMPIDVYLENEQANNNAIYGYVYILCILVAPYFPPRKHHAKYTDTNNFF